MKELNQVFARVEQSKLAKGAVAGGLTALSGVALAAEPTFDVSSILVVVAAVGVAGSAIGAAVTAMIYGLKGWKWVRGAA